MQLLPGPGRGAIWAASCTTNEWKYVLWHVSAISGVSGCSMSAQGARRLPTRQNLASIGGLLLAHVNDSTTPARL